VAENEKVQSIVYEAVLTFLDPTKQVHELPVRIPPKERDWQYGPK
jgi:hypothetical protein